VTVFIILIYFILVDTSLLLINNVNLMLEEEIVVLRGKNYGSGVQDFIKMNISGSIYCSLLDVALCSIILACETPERH
jgi:hypothetical protein